jgi:signal peptidase II
MLKWLWLSAAMVGADQLSKALALALLELHRPLAVLPFFNLTLVFNPGAAFSFLSEAGGWQRWFFSGLAVVLSLVMGIWLARLARGELGRAIGLALVIGGAIGNLIDRLRFGYVVDFFDFHLAGWHWPAFNIADSCITIGVAMLLFCELRGGRREQV